MDYILEEVDVKGKKVTRNLLVKENRIAYISDRSLRMNKTRVNLKGLKLLPSYVMADFSLYVKAEEGSIRESTEQLIRLGCTTVLTVFPMYYERDFEERLCMFRENLAESPIDYVIGLSIPIQKLTPTIIRLCQREKLSFILIEIEHPNDYKKIIWEWIRDANFPYQVQLIPSWDKSNFDGKKKKQVIQHFYSLIEDKELDFIHKEIPEKTAIDLNFLKKLGVYPQKGDLINGSELDYLLYLDNSSQKSLPSVVVKDGSIINACGKTFCENSQGKELIIKRPGIFKSMY